MSILTASNRSFLVMCVIQLQSAKEAERVEPTLTETAAEQLQAAQQAEAQAEKVETAQVEQAAAPAHAELKADATAVKSKI